MELTLDDGRGEDSRDATNELKTAGREWWRRVNRRAAEEGKEQGEEDAKREGKQEGEQEEGKEKRRYDGRELLPHLQHRHEECCEVNAQRLLAIVRSELALDCGPADLGPEARQMNMWAP